MTVESNPQDRTPCRRSDSPHPAQGGGDDLISPVLYDVVMWGFAERNCFGQRVLRSDIQARLDLTEREPNDVEGTPLYVGYRCQACWEVAVSHLTYGQHLCAGSARPVGALTDQLFRDTSSS